MKWKFLNELMKQSILWNDEQDQYTLSKTSGKKVNQGPISAVRDERDKVADTCESQGIGVTYFRALLFYDVRKILNEWISRCI